MARAKKKAGSLRVNFKDMETRTRVGAEGDYPLKCREATSEKSAKGNDMISFVFEVMSGKYKGAKGYFHCTLDEASLWKLHALMTAMGMEVEEDEMDIDLSEFIDQEIVGVFTPDTYNGKRSFKMTDFQSMDDYEAEDEDDDDKPAKGKKGKSKPEPKSKAKGKKSKDEDEDDEEKPKKGKSKPAAKGKSKPADDEDDDEEDEVPKKKGKSAPAKKGKSKKKTYTTEEIEEMDEDELQEVIDDNDLEDEVDLDDYKKLSKKVTAVLEALEEADLIDDD